jgi:hypothetical protein
VNKKYEITLTKQFCEFTAQEHAIRLGFEPDSPEFELVIDAMFYQFCLDTGNEYPGKNLFHKSPYVKVCFGER